MFSIITNGLRNKKNPSKNQIFRIVIYGKINRMRNQVNWVP